MTLATILSSSTQGHSLINGAVITYDSDISERYIKEYQQDAQGLNVRPATIHSLISPVAIRAPASKSSNGICDNFP
mgnify:CR=1 FL=1